MDRDTIVMQLKDVPNSMFWVISGREMAKDLQPLMADGEVVQWFSEALEKNVGHFFANGRRGLRCYTVVTNRKFYYITRGRKDLNLIKAIDKTVVIPVEDIVSIEVTSERLFLDFAYDTKIRVNTRTENFEYYLYTNFEKNTPQSLAAKIHYGTVNSRTEVNSNYTQYKRENIRESSNFQENGNVCLYCGHINVNGAGFCGNCGKEILKKQDPIIKTDKNICPFCGNEISNGAKFCRTCGKEIPEIKEEKIICSQCGNELSEETKFCPICGTPVPEKKEELSEKVVCSQCGYELNEETKFCPICGTPVPEKNEEPQEELPEKVVCSQCVYELNEETKFCPICGTPVIIQEQEYEKQEEIHCVKCGAKIEESMAFCPECGQEVK